MREKILQAAIAEINESGLRFTMEALARRLGTSKRTLYEHFASRKDLISEIMNRTIDELETQDRKILENQQLSKRKKIMELLNYPYKSSLHLTNTFFINLRSLFPLEWNKLINFRVMKLAKIEGLLHIGIEEGNFRQINMDIVRLLLSSYTNALFEPENLHNIDMTWKQAIAAMGDILFNGIVKSRNDNEIAK